MSGRTSRGDASASVSLDDDPLVGTTLNGRFDVVAQLARGGMGKVYRAIQQPLGRPIALKVLDVRGQIAPGPEFHRRFFLEAASAAKLTHPNTIVVYDYGMTTEGVYYIAMELIDGPTLMQTLRARGPMAPERVIHVAMQICGSLGEAHALGLVHRDLKPSNVLLTMRGNDPDFVKVLDFGLVKVLDDDGDDRTQSGVMMGTPRYMSPEQVVGKHVEAPSDIYSLGALMYHSLTGKPPFDSDSKFDILSAHVSQPVPPLRSLYPACLATPQLEAVVMRCMEKEPKNRWATMEKLAAALFACEEELLGVRVKSVPGGIAAPTSGALRIDPLSQSASLPPGVVPKARPTPRPSTSPAREMTGEVELPESAELIARSRTSPPRGTPVLYDAGPSTATMPDTAPPVPYASQDEARELYDAGLPTTPLFRAVAPGSAVSTPVLPAPLPPRPRPIGAPPQPDAPPATFTMPRDGSTARPSSGNGRFAILFAVIAGLAAAGAGLLLFAESPDRLWRARPPPAPTTPPTVRPLDTALPGAPPTAALVPVQLVTTPPGAAIRHEGADLGNTPTTLLVPAGETWDVEVSLPGHTTRVVRVVAGQPAVRVELERLRRPTGGSGRTKRRTENRDPWGN